MTKKFFTALFFVGFLGSTSIHGAQESLKFPYGGAENKCSVCDNITIEKMKIYIDQEIEGHS